MAENFSATPVASAPQTQGVALAALITGLLGIVLGGVFLATDLGPAPLFGSLVLGLLGLILGIVALKKRQSKGMAVTGLITGLIAALFAIALLLFALLFVGALAVSFGP